MKGSLFILLLTISSIFTATTYRNVLYYGDWSIYEGQKMFTLDKLDGSLITHLNFAFMDVDTSGDLITTDTWSDYENPNVGFSVGFENKYAGVLGGFVLLRQKYPNMKIGISVGGWTRSGDFPKVASSESTRNKFAQNCAEFVHYYGYDFVDIDWEYPTADRDPDPEGNGVAIDKGCKGSSADTENFTLLLKALRSALDKYDKIDGKHYELSVAMSASPTMMGKIQYDKVMQIVDYANMMTYDLNGAWEPRTAHQTALYTNPKFDPDDQPDGALSVDSCIQYLKDNYGEKIDYSKVLVGVAPYTRSWTKVDGSTGLDKDNPGLYAKGTGENALNYGYADLPSLISQHGLKKYWDDVAKANYFYGESSGYFYTCDTEESATEKGKYVKKNGLGGLIAWMASLDANADVTRAMKESLFGTGKLPAQEIKSPAVDGASVTISTSGDSYTITLSNKNTLTHSGAGGVKDISVMPQAEKFGKTFSFPALIIETANGETLEGDWSAGGTISSSGGKTIIEPPEWSTKNLGPGDSVEFTLKSGSGTAKKENIKSIAMTQKAVSGGNIISAAIVYGEGAVEIPTGGDDGGKKDDDGGKKDDDGGKKDDDGGKTPSGGASEWSADNKAYKVGDLVTYQGKTYECIYAHNSNEAWTPTAANTLWKAK